MNVLFIDNFDSFTFNLVDELEKRGAAVEVWRNDVPAPRALAMAAALPAPRLIVLSPGPGAPAAAGSCVALCRLVAASPTPLPLFGVCLGHQALVEAFGGEVGFAGEVVHGKATQLEHDDSPPFTGLPNPMTVGRYHSLVGRRIPDTLEVTARAGELVMAVRHKRAPLLGVQFHPESILTPAGGKLMEGVLAWARGHVSPT